MWVGEREAAEALRVSERTLRRWIREGALPAHRIADDWMVHSTELLEWATAHNMAVAPGLFAEEASEAVLERALLAGGVHHEVPAVDMADALRAIVARMPLIDEAERALVVDVLLARESRGSTAVGGGIAIPHARTPIVLRVARPIVTVAFLASPLPCGTPDGTPIHTVFTMVTPTTRMHLRLLSELAFAITTPEVGRALEAKADARALTAAFRAVARSADAAGGPALRSA